MYETLPPGRKFSPSLAISVGAHVALLALFLLTRPRVIEVGLPGATVVDLVGGAAPAEAPTAPAPKAEEAPPQPLPKDEIAAPEKKKPVKIVPPGPPAPKPMPKSQQVPPTATPTTNPTPGPGTSPEGATNPAEARIGLSGAPGVASDFPFGYYLLAIRNKVNQNWVQPGVDRKIKTTVFFRLARDGSVRDARVEVPSGVPLYDQAALRAIRISSPFPRLPDAFTRYELGVHFDFEVTH